MGERGVRDKHRDSKQGLLSYRRYCRGHAYISTLQPTQHFAKRREGVSLLRLLPDCHSKVGTHSQIIVEDFPVNIEKVFLLVTNWTLNGYC